MKSFRMASASGLIFTALWFVMAIILAPTAQARVGNETAPARGVSSAFAGALAAKSGADNLILTFDQPGLAVALDAEGAPIIEDASFNPSTGRFVIRALDAERDGLVALSGVAAPAALVPAPARDIARGGTISEADIEWIPADPRETRAVVSRLDDLIGMAPRRPRPAGEPVRLADLAAPRLVERGDVVTMVVNAPGLRLTHKGLAREAGARRDIITVENVRSGRTIRAVILGEGLVEAAGPTDDARQNRRSRS